MKLDANGAIRASLEESQPSRKVLRITYTQLESAWIDVAYHGEGSSKDYLLSLEYGMGAQVHTRASFHTLMSAGIYSDPSF